MKAIDWLRKKALECNEAAIKCRGLGLDALAKDFDKLNDRINDMERTNWVWNDEVEDEP